MRESQALRDVVLPPMLPQARNSWKRPWKPLSAAVDAGLKRSTQAGGKQEIFKRAHAYAEAGADAVLVHSKSPTFDELKGFAEAWDSPCPHIAVPTTYASITVWDLAFVGFKLVIFANRALRAAVGAMLDSLATLKQEAGPLPEMYELIGVPDLQANEQEYRC
jgi:phosphoenolpyruvate phosphomutase